MWIKGITDNIHGSFWRGTAAIGDYFSLRKENERLALENTALLDQIAKLSAHTEDTTLWKTGRVGFSVTHAHIVSMSRGSLHNYFVIDRGSMDNVEADDGVITPNGVMGIVHSVGTRFSYVLSLKNKDMAVSARIGRSGFVGTMQWNGIHPGESILCNIPIHISFSPGDTVFTSGFSSIFPPDIPLGTLKDMHSDDGSSAQIRVSLFSDYDRTSSVMVVKNLDRKEIQSLSE